MVITLIRFKQILKKLHLGILLEENDIKYLKSFLGLRLGLNHIWGIVLFNLFLISGIILNIYGIWPIAIICYLIGIIALIYFIPVNVKSLMKEYNEALAEYLNFKLPLKSYDFKYTKYLVFPEARIKKENVYFITDGYYFAIVEDLLKAEYSKKGILFKYPDLTSSQIKHIDFKLQDIISYSNIHKFTKFHSDNISDLIKGLPEGKPEFRINLKNFKSISLGNEAGAYFKNLIPEHEEKE